MRFHLWWRLLTSIWRQRTLPLPVHAATSAVADAIVVDVSAISFVAIAASVAAAHANVVICDANADAKMSNVTRYLADGYYDVHLLPPLPLMLMLPRQLMRVDACDDVILKLCVSGLTIDTCKS